MTASQVFREMFCISSRIFLFNPSRDTGLLLKTLLLRYPQRKKSIGDKSGLRSGLRIVVTVVLAYTECTLFIAE